MAGKRSVSFLHWWFLLALVASLGYLFITRYYLSGLFPEDGDIGSVLSLENEFLECQTKDRQNEGVPHFIIIGAQKSGTSALYYLFALHPEIVLPVKFEGHFFEWKSIPGESEATEQDMCYWRQRYRGSVFNLTKYQTMKRELARQRSLQGNSASSSKVSQVVTFEKTPAYMYHPGVAQDVVRLVGVGTRIVVILRNPVDRLYSEYVTNRHKGNSSTIPDKFDEFVMKEHNALKQARLTTAPSLRDYASIFSNGGQDLAVGELLELGFGLDPIQTFAKRRGIVDQSKYRDGNKDRKMCRNSLHVGMYALQLHEWMQYFRLDHQLKVVQYERFRSDRRAVFTEICQFLGLSTSFDIADEFFSQDLSPGRQNDTYNYKGRLQRMKRRGVLERPFPKPHTVDYLLRFYKPYNDELVALLGDEWKDIWINSSLVPGIKSQCFASKNCHDIS